MLIAKDRYLSPEFAARERARMWPKVWLLAGPAVDVAGPGNRFTVDLGDESIVVVRTRDGVRAYHNVCPHRGNRLCEGRGQGPVLTCPYHGWTFGLDGKPVAAEAGLAPVRCEVLAGLVWICLAPRGPGLKQYLGPAWQRLAQHRFDEWGLVMDVTLTVQCNWKTSVDAHNEILHLATLHPDVNEQVDREAVTVRKLGRHAAMTVPFKGGEAPNHFTYLFPNVQLNLYEKELMLLRHRPHATDPEAAYFDQLIFNRAPLRSAPPSGKARRGPPRAAHREGRPGEISLGAVTDADVSIVERVQRGMRSAGFKGLRVGPEEACIAHMHKVLDGYLRGRG